MKIDKLPEDTVLNSIEELFPKYLFDGIDIKDLKLAWRLMKSRMNFAFPKTGNKNFHFVVWDFFKKDKEFKNLNKAAAVKNASHWAHIILAYSMMPNTDVNMIADTIKPKIILSGVFLILQEINNKIMKSSMRFPFINQFDHKHVETWQEIFFDICDDAIVDCFSQFP